MRDQTRKTVFRNVLQGHDIVYFDFFISHVNHGGKKTHVER